MDYLNYLNNKMFDFLTKVKMNIYEIKIQKDQNYDYLIISLFKKNDYINVEECSQFHKYANNVLNNANDIKASILEVMSVGVNTVVKNDYQLNLLLNLVISCKLITPINNFYIFDGILVKFDNQFIYLSNKFHSEIKINRNSIKEIKIDK